MIVLGTLSQTGNRTLHNYGNDKQLESFVTVSGGNILEMIEIFYSYKKNPRVLSLNLEHHAFRFRDGEGRRE